MAVLAALEDEAGGLADLERELRRDHAVGAAANAVGTEIFASHALEIPSPGIRGDACRKL